MPFPMEVVYIPIALAIPSKALVYTALLITSSIIGSIAAYWVGRIGGGNFIFKLRFVKKHFNQMQLLYNKNAFLVIMTSSFTPIPYEVYTLTAGFFNVNFQKYIIASILSRIIRYTPQGILIYLYGDTVLSLLKRYGMLSAVVLCIVLVIIKYLFISISKTK